MDAYVKSVSDVLEATEVDAGIVIRLPALDLLLGDPDSFGKPTLRELSRDTRLDERRRQVIERVDLAFRDLPVAQLLIAIYLGAQLLRPRSPSRRASHCE